MIVRQSFNRGVLIKALETFFGVAQINDHGIRLSSVLAVRRLRLEIVNNINLELSDELSEVSEELSTV